MWREKQADTRLRRGRALATGLENGTCGEARSRTTPPALHPSREVPITAPC